MAVAIGQITLVDVLDGEQGLPGVPGAQGPAGTPGFLGLIVSGSTLSLKGYDANGMLQASVGYIYIDGSRYTVPEYSLTLTGIGQGYILFNPSWDAPVRFAKMIVDDSNIVYKDYNTLAVLGYSAYVIGQFYKDQSIYDYKIINAQSTKNFEKSSFMEILSNSDVVSAEINSWASALGVSQVFQKIAVLEALIGSLIAGKIRVGGGSEESGFLFKAEVVDGQAIIAAYYDGNKVFYIDGNTGSVEMAGTGKFLGLIDSEPFLTQPYVAGASIPSSPSNSIWSTDELYSELTTISESETIQSASGSYDGKTINGITRLLNGVKPILQVFTYSSQMTLSNSTAYAKVMILGKIIVSPNSGNISAIFTGYTNKTTDANTTVRLGESNTDYSVGATMEQALYDGDYSGEYKIIRTISETSEVGYSGAHSTYLYLFALIGDKDDSATTYSYFSNISITERSSISGKGVFLRYTDNTYALIVENQRRNDVLSLTSPSWASSGNLNYKSGTDFYNAFSSLTLGISTPCSGTVSITGGGYTNKTINPLFVTKNAISITFQTSTEYVVVNKWGGQGSIIGVYTSLSCSITITGQLSAIRFKNALPFIGESVTIGQGSNRISAYFGTNMDVTTFNSAGTGNKVYGAVFN